MTKLLRQVLSAPLFVAGAILALYGIFALVYTGDGGRTYVEIAGSDMDAHLTGGISLAAAAVLIASGTAAARRNRIG